MRQRIRNAVILFFFLTFPITLNYFSPYIIIDGIAQGIIAGSALMFAAQFFSALFLGRAFCGWVCPAGGLQDYCTTINNKKAKNGKANWIKYFIWTPWIALIIFAGLKSGGIVKVDPFHLTDYGISVSNPWGYINYFFVVFLIVTLSFIFGKRAFCHYGCWMAPFMVIGLKARQWLHIPSLKLKSLHENCNNCQRCNQVCLMSLDVNKMVTDNEMNHSECILCGKCVDNCKQKAIKYVFSSK
jgi:ferredoxin-type protein NapH